MASISPMVIVFLCENDFSRGVGGSLSYLWKFQRGGGAISSLQKWKIQGGGGVVNKIPSVVGVWIFSGTTQWLTNGL